MQIKRNLSIQLFFLYCTAFIQVSNLVGSGLSQPQGQNESNQEYYNTIESADDSNTSFIPSEQIRREWPVTTFRETVAPQLCLANGCKECPYKDKYYSEIQKIPNDIFGNENLIEALNTHNYLHSSKMGMNISHRKSKIVNFLSEIKEPLSGLSYSVGFWHGLWDSWNYSGNEFNTTKVPDPSKAREVEGNVFVSLSHRWKGKTRQQWQAILRGMKSIISDLDPERTIILLQDEPLTKHHGFSLEEMQFLYDTAKDLMPDYKFGFSFTRGTVNNRELPICDFIILPAYPFFRSDYPDIQISTKQEFDNWFDSHIAKARAKHSGNIFVIGQGFYNPESAEDRKRKWRKPPLEAAGWYAEAVQRNNLSGIFWWVYSIDRKDVVGLENMPEYFDEIRLVFSLN